MSESAKLDKILEALASVGKRCLLIASRASPLLRFCVLFVLQPTRPSASTLLNLKSAAPLPQPLPPLHLAAAATWPRLSKVRSCIMCVQSSVASSQLAAYDALVAEFMPPILAAAQSIKNAGKGSHAHVCACCNLDAGLIKQTTLLAEAFAEQRRMVLFCNKRRYLRGCCFPPPP